MEKFNQVRGKVCYEYPEFINYLVCYINQLVQELADNGCITLDDSVGGKEKNQNELKEVNNNEENKS